MRQRAYPVQSAGGILFVYMGPTPAPLLPRWDVLVWEDGQRGSTAAAGGPDCNWLQAQENSADVTHTYFLHGHMLYQQGSAAGGVDTAYRPIERYGFQPFEWGLLKSWRIRSGGSSAGRARRRQSADLPEHAARTSATWPRHALPRADRRHHTQIFVGRLRARRALRVAGGSWRTRQSRTIRRVPARMVAPLMANFFSQDRMAWETQGAIFDRSHEHLGASDRGIILFRALLREQIERVQQGQEPFGLLRDPAVTLIELPMWVVDDSGAQGDEFAAQAGWAKTGQPMSKYFDERQEWFEVPEGAARTPGALS